MAGWEQHREREATEVTVPEASSSSGLYTLSLTSVIHVRCYTETKEPNKSEGALCTFLFGVYVTHGHFSTVRHIVVLLLFDCLYITILVTGNMQQCVFFNLAY